MDRAKMIPIIIAILLAIIALVIIGFTSKKDRDFYDKLVVSYDNNSVDYEALKVDTKIKLNDVNFYIIAVQKDLIVLNTDELISIDNKDVSEFKVTYQKSVSVCFKDQTCAKFELVWGIYDKKCNLYNGIGIFYCN